MEINQINKSDLKTNRIEEEKKILLGTSDLKTNRTMEINQINKSDLKKGKKILLGVRFFLFHKSLNSYV